MQRPTIFVAVLSGFCCLTIVYSASASNQTSVNSEQQTSKTVTTTTTTTINKTIKANYQTVKVPLNDLKADQAEAITTNHDVVQKRTVSEQQQATNPFVVSLYKPNYLLPFYYTFSPYHSIYVNNTPDNQNIENIDVKFQFSIKVPIFTNMFNLPSSLYIAYTQLSYWQAYNHSPFFRESNYEPAAFIANNINWQWPLGWQMNFLNLGIKHQSNGRGGDLERSWNRLYAELIFSKGDWMLELEPWYALDDSSIRIHNPDIEHYLGHARLIVAYKFHNNTFALETYNNVESSFHRGTFQLSWSFPLTTHLKGYVQYFNGFGQSLLEYNHRTSNSIGAGISISDWI